MNVIYNHEQFTNTKRYHFLKNTELSIQARIIQMKRNNIQIKARKESINESDII